MPSFTKLGYKKMKMPEELHQVTSAKKITFNVANWNFRGIKTIDAQGRVKGKGWKGRGGGGG